MISHTLNYSFYERSCFTVARELLGHVLISDAGGQRTSGKIVEVEPYVGAYDRACHAWPMKRTVRTDVMFGPGGRAYIFFVYGMYHQLCVVTGREGSPDAVLIRALEPLEGQDAMRRRRGRSGKDVTNGPGKLCMALGITKALYGVDMTDPSGELFIEPGEAVLDEQVVAAPRVGVGYAGEYACLPWRFYLKDNLYVSKKDPDARSYGDIPEETFGPVL